MAAKRRPDTLWKLVDARATQLADSVSGARAAFLVALTWSFIWAWALYSADNGYLVELRDRYGFYYASSLASDPRVELKQWCARTFPRVASANDRQLPADDKLEFCKQTAKTAFEWVDKAYLDSTLLSFPGGFAKLSVSDLGVIGQIGMLIILFWLFYAARRENHAIRAIVDMDTETRKKDSWSPQRFVLESQDQYLSAEHVAYAYHSVAQRFVFIFSHHSRPLLSLTFLLLSIPALVGVWNFVTDVRDLVDLFLQPVNFAILLRTTIEAFLLICVLLTTFRIARAELDTSVLLNGWFLAARDVWMEEWDETTHEPASPAIVFVNEQKAKRFILEKDH